MIFFIFGVAGAGFGLLAAGLWYAAGLVFGIPLPDPEQIRGLVLGGACLMEVAAVATALVAA